MGDSEQPHLGDQSAAGFGTAQLAPAQLIQLGQLRAGDAGQVFQRQVVSIAVDEDDGRARWLGAVRGFPEQAVLEGPAVARKPWSRASGELVLS